MKNKTIIIEFENGKSKTYSLSEFDFFAEPNELEHKEQCIIIKMSDLTKSFTYEIDENDEIIHKEAIKITFVS